MLFQTEFHSPTRNSSSQKPLNPHTSKDRTSTHNFLFLLKALKSIDLVRTRKKALQFTMRTSDWHLLDASISFTLQFSTYTYNWRILRPQDRPLGYDHLLICSKHKNHSISVLCTNNWRLLDASRYFAKLWWQSPNPHSHTLKHRKCTRQSLLLLKPLKPLDLLRTKKTTPIFVCALTVGKLWWEVDKIGFLMY